jgi:hypothetical protein
MASNDLKSITVIVYERLFAKSFLVRLRVISINLFSKFHLLEYYLTLLVYNHDITRTKYGGIDQILNQRS